MLVLKDCDVIFNKGSINEKHALKNINLEINSTDFITIIGSNGAGKSTLLNAIFGMIKLSSGSIVLNDKDISNKEVYKRAKDIGFLFQNPQLGTAPNMTIEENIRLSLSKTKQKLTTNDIKQYLSVLDMGLESRLKTPVCLLSGGQRQALTLLMATISNPKLLLLDEHTAALDPKMSKHIMQLTKKIIKEKQIPTIMITHNISDALEYGNKIIFMDNGKIIKTIEGKEKKDLTIPSILELYNNKLSDNMIL